MDRLTVQAKEDGQDVEIDRCAECGALWFDAGELEVVGELTAKELHGKSELPCPVCREPLYGATIEGGITAWRCNECYGTWINGDTVLQLARRKLPGSVLRPKGDVGFICAICSGKFPFAEGNANERGLICGGCVVNPRPGKLRPGERTSDMPGPWPEEKLRYGLSDAITSIAELFDD